MKYKYFLFLILLYSINALSQGGASIWYLGNGNAIDFRESPPKVINNGPVDNARFASISDEDGNLLFYCNHNTVWNSSNQVMENGTGLEGFWLEKSVILPFPQNDSLYYIIQISFPESDSPTHQVIYSLINIHSANGKGVIIEKNIKLYDNAQPHFTLGGNCENGYWLIGPQDSNAFGNIDGDGILAFRISENGISKSPIISVPADIGFSTSYRISPLGDKLFFSYNGNSEQGSAIADFNLKTGEVSNVTNIGPCCSFGEFSEDGKMLYTVNMDYNGELRQYDLTTPQYSNTLIANIDTYHETQLAPDGKIYFLLWQEEKAEIAVIDFPSKVGLSCNFRREAFQFENELLDLGLPEFASHLLYKGPNKVDAGNDIEVCVGEEIQIGGENIQSWDFEWFPKSHLDNPYVSNPFFLFSNPIDTSIVLTYKLKGCNEDKLKVTVHPNPKPIIAGSKSVCPGVELVEYKSDSVEGNNYEWYVYGGEIDTTNGNNQILVNWGSTNPNAFVSLIQTNQYMCSAKTKFDVRVNVLLETEQPEGPDLICHNMLEDITYKISPTNGSIYTWEVYGGKIMEGQGTNKVSVNWNDDDKWIRVMEESRTIDTVCFGESPKLNVNIFKDSLQSKINFVSVDPEDESKIILNGNVYNTVKETINVNIQRRENNLDQWDTIFLSVKPWEMFEFQDEEVDPGKSIYQYKVSAMDGCYEKVESKTHNSILLEPNLDDGYEISLTWNPYQGWENGVKRYELYRQIDERPYELYAVLDKQNYFHDNSSSDGFLHSFRVKAIHENDEYYSFSNSVQLKFDHQLYIPNVFTPNGDGINETFMIKNIELFLHNDLQIFNRYGKLIYSKKHYSGDWSGDDLPSGMYYYQFIDIMESKVYNGWLSILK